MGIARALVPGLLLALSGCFGRKPVVPADCERAPRVEQAVRDAPVDDPADRPDRVAAWTCDGPLTLIVAEGPLPAGETGEGRLGRRVGELLRGVRCPPSRAPCPPDPDVDPEITLTMEVLVDDPDRLVTSSTYVKADGASGELIARLLPNDQGRIVVCAGGETARSTCRERALPIARADAPFPDDSSGPP